MTVLCGFKHPDAPEQDIHHPECERGNDEAGPERASGRSGGLWRLAKHLGRRGDGAAGRVGDGFQRVLVRRAESILSLQIRHHDARRLAELRAVERDRQRLLRVGDDLRFVKAGSDLTGDLLGGRAVGGTHGDRRLELVAVVAAAVTRFDGDRHRP